MTHPGRCAAQAALAILALIVTVGMASAGLTAKQLAAVGVRLPAGARVPMTQSLPGENGARTSIGQAIGGKPTAMIFADYTCGSLCGPILAIAANGLDKSGLTAGKDFRLLVIGLDPRDGADTARQMQQDQIGAGALASASTFLLSENPAIQQITSAVGYHYAYDASIDQYAHPAVVYILAGDGRVTRVLAALGLDAADLRLALVEAGKGQIGTVTDYLHLLCYGFDPAKGIYTFAILRWLTIAGVATVLALAGTIFLMLRGRRPEGIADQPPSAPIEQA